MRVISLNKGYQKVKYNLKCLTEDPNKLVCYNQQPYKKGYSYDINIHDSLDTIMITINFEDPKLKKLVYCIDDFFSMDKVVERIKKVLGNREYYIHHQEQQTL